MYLLSFRRLLLAPMEAHQMVQKLSLALTTAKQAVEADKNGDYPTALVKYREVHAPPPQNPQIKNNFYSRSIKWW